MLDGLDRRKDGSRNGGFPDALPKRKDVLDLLDNGSHAMCKRLIMFKLDTAHQIYDLCLFDVLKNEKSGQDE